MAYTIPVIIIGGCWFAWRHRQNDDYIDYFAVSLRLIGALALILTSCGLAAINADDIWYFASGGVIGSLLSSALQPMLHSSGGTLALLCIWAAGLTLFTGWSWVSIAEKIGSFVLTILTFASNRTRRDDTWVDEDEYEDEYEEEDDAPVQRRESRRARILRRALARRQRVAEKFANPLGRKPMRRSSPVNAWTKTIMLSTVQPVPPSILMMCFSLAVAPHRAILMNTIHC